MPPQASMGEPRRLDRAAPGRVRGKRRIAGEQSVRERSDSGLSPGGEGMSGKGERDSVQEEKEEETKSN